MIRCKNLALYIRDCVSLCLSAETLNAFGPFYLVRERRGSAVVSTSACHAGSPGSLLGPGTLLRIKTWLSTLEIVYLSRCLSDETLKAVGPFYLAGLETN